MAVRGGVMGIRAIRGFVRSHEPTTIDEVLDHFDHVAKIAGIEHLGVGSDNDLEDRDRNSQYHRMDIGGLDHPRRIYDLTEAGSPRLYEPAHSNFQRALGEIWAA